MPVEAILPIEAGHPYKAVRVRGSTNAVTLKTIPGYIEAPGYAEGAAAKEDCAKCLGKYFVAKGRQPASRRGGRPDRARGRPAVEAARDQAQ